MTENYTQLNTASMLFVRRNNELNFIMGLRSDLTTFYPIDGAMYEILSNLDPHNFVGNANKHLEIMLGINLSNTQIYESKEFLSKKYEIVEFMAPIFMNKILNFYFVRGILLTQEQADAIASSGKIHAVHEFTYEHFEKFIKTREISLSQSKIDNIRECFKWFKN